MRYFLIALLSTSLVMGKALPLHSGAKNIAPQEFLGYVQQALENNDWWSAIDCGSAMLEYFPESPFVQEIPFFIGLSYFSLDQYEQADAHFTNYLKKTQNPRYFELAIEKKFTIAEFFRQGGKRHLFGSPKLPAILPADEEALRIYDEVIAVLPHCEIAAKSLLGKAKVQAALRDFKPSIDTLQLLIRRFPKQKFAAEAFLEISRNYLQQCKVQQLDPNLLDLAQSHLKKFHLAFPREEKLQEADSFLLDMKEIFAQNLFETGKFFLRRKHPNAARVYFNKLLQKYPDTQTAALVSKEYLEIT